MTLTLALAALLACPSQGLPPDWPVRADLSTGQSVEFRLRDGSVRTVKLVSYRAVHRARVDAAVEVTGGGRSDRTTINVGMGAVPVCLNGVRVYAYVWKEAGEKGFEKAGDQGSLPIAAGKDVGLALSDARFTMYPDMDRYAFPFENAFHEGHDLQTFLEEDGWAHAGYDVGVHSEVRLRALTDGVVTIQQYGSGPNRQGQVILNPNGPFTTPGWHFSHISGTRAPLVKSGERVKKGTPIAYPWDGGGFPYHYHMGSRHTCDFGSFHFAAEIWRHQRRDDFPAPRYWLVLAPYPGDLKSARLHAGEEGDLPGTLQPREGDPDREGARSWRFYDNFVNSVVRMGEASSPYPFGGYQNFPVNSVGYGCVYLYSSAPQQVHLKWGLSRAGKVWLNGKTVFDGAEARYATYEVLRESPIVIDKYDLPLRLRAGWNTLLVKTDHGDRKHTAWLFSAKIGDKDGRRLPEDALAMSVRDIRLEVAGAGKDWIEVRWRDPGRFCSYVESFRVDVATDPAFERSVRRDVDVGKATAHAIRGLSPGTKHFVRVKPYNASDRGGTVYWQHCDVVEGSTR